MEKFKNKPILVFITVFNTVCNNICDSKGYRST